jgi:hypothetical protein
MLFSAVPAISASKLFCSCSFSGLSGLSGLRVELQLERRNFQRVKVMPKPTLKIRLKRRADGSAALTCEREDGSVTWQRQEGSIGLVFPSHDLTHYAVESALGYDHGFFGLVADGWDISDFASPWSRGPIPPEALEVELIVGLLDMQRLMNADWTAAELLEQGKLYVESRSTKAPLPALTQEMFTRVCDLRRDVFARYAAVSPGDTLELVFDRSVTRSHAS